MTRFLPSSLAARFTIILAVALIVANAVSFVVLNFERNRELRDFRRNSQIERLVTLVPALNALEPELRRDVVRASSGRRLRLRLARRPIVTSAPTNNLNTKSLVEDIGQALILPAGREIRVQTIDAQAGENRNGRQRTTVNIAIPLLDGTWLNARHTNFVRRPFVFARDAWLTLAFSLFGVLAVGLMFIHRLTKPLRDLTAAAIRVGKGDRSMRLDENGAAELKNTAHAFNTMQDNIDRFDAERARTVAAVGHDLRTPITSLRLRAEMMEDADLRQPMIQTLDDMKVMADELMHWGKNGDLIEPQQIVDLSALLASICETSQVQFTPSADIFVSAQPVALRRALTNIVDNASRYGQQGAAYINLADNSAIVTIEDRGPGIPESQMKTIFDPFTRGDASRSKDSGGVGLGLSIAKSVIESHKGTIAIKNRTEGSGTVVTIKIPSR